VIEKESTFADNLSSWKFWGNAGKKNWCPDYKHLMRLFDDGEGADEGAGKKSVLAYPHLFLSLFDRGLYAWQLFFLVVALTHSFDAMECTSKYLELARVTDVDLGLVEQPNACVMRGRQEREKSRVYGLYSYDASSQASSRNRAIDEANAAEDRCTYDCDGVCFMPMFCTGEEDTTDAAAVGSSADCEKTFQQWRHDSVLDYSSIFDVYEFRNGDWANDWFCSSLAPDLCQGKPPYFCAQAIAASGMPEADAETLLSTWKADYIAACSATAEANATEVIKHGKTFPVVDGFIDYRKKSVNLYCEAYGYDKWDGTKGWFPDFVVYLMTTDETAPSVEEHDRTRVR
jgi:hypothetical protein